ncbi:hypothetical protein V8B97DRAFT_2025508 [Scleroderma yunnanense]
MITKEVVPVDLMWDKIVMQAIHIVIELVIGHTQVVEPVSTTKDVIGQMAALQCTFKQYVLCHVHGEFGLCLEQVRYLLTDFNYLHDLCCPEHELFLSLFFQNFIIDMLFVISMDLWQYVEGNSLDILFRLAGAAIAAMLRDFSLGYHDELDSSASRCLQKTIMVQRQARLPPTLNMYKEIDLVVTN